MLDRSRTDERHKAKQELKDVPGRNIELSSILYVAFGRVLILRKDSPVR